MLNEYEVAAFIERKLPELKQAGIAVNCTDVFKTINILSGYLKHEYKEGHIDGVKKVLQVAESIHDHGNQTVKTGIENVFIFSFSSIMPTDNSARAQLQALIPVGLFSIYVQQVFHSGI